MRESKTDPGFDEDYDEAIYERRLLRHPLVIGLGAIALFALGFGAFVLLNGQSGTDQIDGGAALAPAVASPAGTSTTALQPAGAGGSTNAEGTSAAEGSATVSTTAGSGSGTQLAVPSGGSGLAPVPQGQAFVEAKLNLDAGPGPEMFHLTGRVPDAQTAQLLKKAAEISYAPYVQSDIAVDPSLAPAPWLATSAKLIGLLPSVTDGTIRVVDGKVQVEARSPNKDYLALLEGALTQLGGMPVSMANTEITNLVPPRFVVATTDGKINLSGEVPSPAIKELLEGGAAATYGAGNVSSQLAVNPGTYTSFWMFTMPGIFQLFTPFPRYSFQVVNGQSSGTLQGGVGFDVNSVQIGPAAAKVLNVGVSIMARDLSLGMMVTGHTDATGPDDHNQVLSEARAKSVVDYMAGAGIDAGRLKAVGKGEKEPIAPNTDPAGRAQNRRVEFTFGPASG